MNWLDLGIVIFVIIFIVVGIKQGLMTSILSHFSLSLNCMISMFFYKPIAFIFNKLFKLGPAIQNHFFEKLVAKSANLSTNLVTVPKENLKSVVTMAINDGDFGFIQKTMFKTFINKKNLADILQEKGYESRCVAEIISEAYSTFLLQLFHFLYHSLLSMQLYGHLQNLLKS